MEQHPIENIMQSTMTNIKDMVDVNTIVGDSVVMADGTVIIPVSRIGFGFVSGGGEYGNANAGKGVKAPEYGQEAGHLPFAGGSGAGVSVSPVAFLVAGNGKVQLLPVATHSPFERIIDIVPAILSDIRSMMGRDDDEESDDSSDDE